MNNNTGLSWRQAQNGQRWKPRLQLTNPDLSAENGHWNDMCMPWLYCVTDVLQVKPMLPAVILPQHCLLCQVTCPIRHFHTHLLQMISFTFSKMKVVLCQTQMQQVNGLILSRFGDIYIWAYVFCLQCSKTWLLLLLSKDFCDILQWMPSVLWRCWLCGRKGIRPVKNWVVGCWHGYLSGVRCWFAYGPADTTATHCLLLQ